jgi:ketosteroid isomerase-like protein
MKFAISLIAVACLTVGAACAAGTTATQQKLVDLEATWSKAMTMKDTATISNIVADDWSGQDDSGKRMNKAGFLDMIKTGKMATSTMTNHDVSARVMGNVAVVQGMDDEKSAFAGKDTSGTYSWTDVFMNRGGKWQAIASQVTKVEK